MDTIRHAALIALGAFTLAFAYASGTQDAALMIDAGCGMMTATFFAVLVSAARI